MKTPRLRSPRIACLVTSVLLLSGAVAGVRAEAATGTNPPPRTDGAPPGYRIVEGDIQVRIEDFISGTYGPATYWPNNVIPYQYNAALNATQQGQIRAAMDTLMLYTGVVLVPWIASDPNWVRFDASTGNNSPVGMQNPTPNVINITSFNSCFIIAHEILHTMGMRHEQSRSDRGTYVTIQSANICQTCCPDAAGNPGPCDSQFAIVPGSSTYGPYDFDSVMHYGATFFTANGQPTIVVNPPWSTDPNTPVIGQRAHLSFFDKVNARGLYPVGNDRWLNSSAVHNNAGSFLQPWNLSLASAIASAPVNCTLFLAQPGTYSAVGLHSHAVTIRAPQGAVLGN